MNTSDRIMIKITGCLTYGDFEFDSKSEIESMVSRLEQEGIAVDIFPEEISGTQIELSFFNEEYCDFENKILDILTKNNLELLSGEITVWTSEDPEKTHSYCVQEDF